MKSIYGYLAGGLALTFGLAACIPAAAPAPPPATPAEASPAQTPEVRVPPSAPAPPPSIADNWLDRPQTVGDWAYERETSETFAIFARPDARPLAIVRCDLNKRLVGIGRFDNPATSEVSVLIRTEAMDRELNASPRGSISVLVAAEVSANDPLLDAIALTRGRFALALSGQQTLYLPAWGEVTRVIEDCR